MYIRRVKKKDPKTGTIYFYHQLIESYRTPNEPRQRILLNLGRLDLEPEDLKILADRIERILLGQNPILLPPQEIEILRYEGPLFCDKKCAKALYPLSQSKTGKGWILNLLNPKMCISLAPWEDIDRVKVIIVEKPIHPASEREITSYGVI